MFSSYYININFFFSGLWIDKYSFVRNLEHCIIACYENLGLIINIFAGYPNIRNKCLFLKNMKNLICLITVSSRFCQIIQVICNVEFKIEFRFFQIKIKVAYVNIFFSKMSTCCLENMLEFFYNLMEIPKTF